MELVTLAVCLAIGASAFVSIITTSVIDNVWMAALSVAGCAAMSVFISAAVAIRIEEITKTEASNTATKIAVLMNIGAITAVSLVTGVVVGAAFILCVIITYGLCNVFFK